MKMTEDQRTKIMEAVELLKKAVEVAEIDEEEEEDHAESV